MTRSFNVLDPNEDIHQSYLLEASAGTGKTFAIENIVVRKLLEGDAPLKLEDIVIVTFTKAAVADLKNRIYKNIKEHYYRLKDPRLDDAIQTFHEASILTIHGFCQRMLQETGLDGGTSIQTVGNLSASLYKRIITDFIQVLFNDNRYSIRQIEILRGNGSIEKLIEKIIFWVKKGVPCEELPPFSEQKEGLKTLWEGCGDRILETIRALMLQYNKLKGMEELIPESIASNDFDALLDLTKTILLKFVPENIKKTCKNPQPLPAPLIRLKETAQRFVSVNHLLSDLVEKCRKHVAHYCEMEDLTPFDLLLTKMENACASPSFCETVRKRYKLAIVDEFQDTDPVQWAIFRSLFVGERQLILVGDPKQSIYGFRQADIYTYQSAADSLGNEARRSLDTNFRSTPPLVDALNALFNPDHTPGWIPLPRSGTFMRYEQVKAGRAEAPNEGGITFQFAKSEDELFTGIAQTLIEQSIPLNSTAILIADRYQAERMAQTLRKAKIPYVIQNRELLTKTTAWGDWIAILKAILHPKNRSLVKFALGTTFIGFNHVEIRELDRSDALPFIMEQFVALKKCWIEQGLSKTTEQLNSACFFNSDPFSHHSLRERLLMKEGGALYLQDLEQIQDVFLEEEALENLSPQEIVSRAKDLQEIASEEDLRLLSHQDLVQQGVRILTIHSSKGLEFETVFTPGLIKDKKQKEPMVPQFWERQTFCPIFSLDDPIATAYLEEHDAEKMRQFYVALTRAKTNLFVSCLFPEKSSRLSLGAASPMQLFFARMGRPLHKSPDALYETINSLTPDEVAERLPKHPAISSEWIKTGTLKTYSKVLENRPLSEPAIPVIPGRPTYIDSFTSLSQILPHSPRNTETIDKSIDPIPAGAETGIILHKIFECIDFSNPEPLRYLRGTLLEPWKEEIECLVRRTVTYTFPEGFTLQSIPLEEQFREIEFLYPSSTGYIKGVIDLIFHHNGKIHIVDWKSNLLPNYLDSTLKEAMDFHHYFLQAKLYKEAAKRYFGDLPVIIDYFFVRGGTSYRIGDSDVG